MCMRSLRPFEKDEKQWRGYWRGSWGSSPGAQGDLGKSSELMRSEKGPVMGQLAGSGCQDFNKPGVPSTGMPLAAPVSVDTDYHRGGSQASFQTDCWAVAGNVLATSWVCNAHRSKEWCLRECSFWSQRVNYAKWYVHLSNEPFLNVCYPLSRCWAHACCLSGTLQCHPIWTLTPCIGQCLQKFRF